MKFFDGRGSMKFVLAIFSVLLVHECHCQEVDGIVNESKAWRTESEKTVSQPFDA